jgi:hypothetical protein
MTPDDLGHLALQLKKAKRADKPYFFFFLKAGVDGDPELIVERKAELARTRGRKARAASSTKLFVRGRVEAHPDGGVGFFGEGKIPATQVQRLFRQSLAKAPELSSVAQLLKEASIEDLATAPSIVAEGLQDEVGGLTDDSRDVPEVEEATDDQWKLRSAEARDLSLKVKERFGGDSEEHEEVEQLRQAAANARSVEGLAAGIDALELLVITARRLLGTARKPTLDWGAVAGAVQLARKASQPFWFWYCRKGADDLPVLVVERRRSEMQRVAKAQRRTAQKKAALQGWIELDDGQLVLWAEGKLPFAQVERDFRQRLAPIDDLSVVAALLRGVSVRDAEDAELLPDEVGYADAAAHDERIRQAVDEGSDEVFDKLVGPGADPVVRVTLLRTVWDRAAGGLSSALGRIGAVLRDDPLLAAHPDGEAPLKRLDEIEDWYVQLTTPVDTAFGNVGTDSFSQAALLAALKTARKGLAGRSELAALEETPLGSPALHTQPLAAIDRVVDGLSVR